MIIERGSQAFRRGLRQNSMRIIGGALYASATVFSGAGEVHGNDQDINPLDVSTRTEALPHKMMVPGVAYDAKSPFELNAEGEHVLIAPNAGADGVFVPPTPEPTSNPVTAAGESWPVSLAPCGGDLPPCWVANRESRGDYNAVNPTGCYQRGSDGVYYVGCYGKWQFSIPTWGGYMGYYKATDAPPAIQDARAREVWNNGRGCSHWAAC